MTRCWCSQDSQLCQISQKILSTCGNMNIADLMETLSYKLEKSKSILSQLLIARKEFFLSVPELVVQVLTWSQQTMLFFSTLISTRRLIYRLWTELIGQDRQRMYMCTDQFAKTQQKRRFYRDKPSSLNLIKQSFKEVVISRP